MASDQGWTPRVRRVGGIAQERLQYAGSLMRERRFDEARDELLSLLHEDEKSIQARMMLGTLYSLQRMLPDALDQFKYAIELDPLQARPHLRAGVCCMRMNDLDRAKQLLRTALDIDPKQPDAHFAMAQLLEKSGESEEAIAHLEEALQLDPQMMAARMKMADLLSESGNVDDAISELEAFVDNNQGSPAGIQLAVLQTRQGNYQKAIELLQVAAAAKPEVPRIHALLGRIKAQAEDYAGAEAAFKRSLELKSDGPPVQLGLVRALLKQNKLEEARDVLKRIPRAGRITGLVHWYYGDLYAAMKRPGDAVQSYRAAILHSAGGEQTLAEIEKEAGPDIEAKLRLFQAAVAKLEQDWRAKVAESGNVRARFRDRSASPLQGPRSA